MRKALHDIEYGELPPGTAESDDGPPPKRSKTGRPPASPPGAANVPPSPPAAPLGGPGTASSPALAQTGVPVHNRATHWEQEAFGLYKKVPGTAAAPAWEDRVDDRMYQLMGETQ